jgi:hypothetical protein
VDLDITISSTREATNRRTASCLALAGNLMVSVPLWWSSGNAATADVDAYGRWVVATATTLVITLLVGAALRRNETREAMGDGVLRAVVFLVILYVVWHGYTFALIAD